MVNCATPCHPTLIESEMFGHVRGAFTGADAERTGKFAAVGRGTLFLDEIDSLPRSSRPNCCESSRSGPSSRSARTRPLRLQARLIVASNRPLEGEVAAGRFRSDLFYRLNVVAFDIPPLRERIAVLPALARRSSPTTPPATAAGSTASPPRPCRPCSPTPGPATSASCAT